MTMKPNNCVILGIDSGETSGWSIFAKDIWHGGDIETTHAGRRHAFTTAKIIAGLNSLPLIIGREAWSPGWQRGRRSFNSIIGTGASWGKWEAVLEEAGVLKSRIFSVKPNIWRPAVLGLRPGKYSRDQAKQWAIQFCKIKGWYNDQDLDHNQAEATCIAFYFVYDPRVAKAILHPNRLKKL